MKTTVEQIHAEVDSARHRLLEEARRIITENKTDFSKTDRLVRLGFVNSSEVVENKKKLSTLSLNREQAEIISYYIETYPFLKFLTEGEFDRICEKYNLIHAPVKNYTQSVPEKNLGEIEKSQPLHSKDAIKFLNEIKEVNFPEELAKFLEFIGKSNAIFSDKEVSDSHIQYRGHIPNNWAFGTSGDHMVFHDAKKAAHCDFIIKKYERTDCSGLFIAAPKSHFNLKDLSKKSKRGFLHVLEIEPKDPIVFRYCRGGIQVITKWGEEAEDKDLIVPLNN